MIWKAVYCLFSEEHTLMFGTDVLNKKSMVGQVRESFTNGRSQEMEIFLKSINHEISTFCTARSKLAFCITSIQNSAINRVKIKIFKHYSRMTSVLGPGEHTKSIDLERQVTNYGFGLPFHLLFILSIHMVQTELGGVFIYRESLRQTSALLWLGLKHKCIFPFSRIFISFFAKFRVNRPNNPIFSRKF
jgi:hypothetical protein